MYILRVGRSKYLSPSIQENKRHSPAGGPFAWLRERTSGELSTLLTTVRGRRGCAAPARIAKRIRAAEAEAEAEPVLDDNALRTPFPSM